MIEVLEVLDALAILLNYSCENRTIELLVSDKDMTLIHTWRDRQPEEVKSRMTFVYLAWVAPGHLLVRDLPSTYSI